ncbi:MAG: DNA polymerase III subunit delta' [Saccharospirillum sp.]|nr:DNA polymerase III subunit delta' [Saccharospirillum sp.]
MINKLPWLTPQIMDSRQQLQAGKLPHGLLLVGRPGDGLHQMGEHLANTILCGKAEAPCGQCKACQLFLAGTHPDYRLLEPEGKSETIKIEPIRAMSAFMSGTAQQGGARVVRLRSAERMNTSAANALLKVLEEPGRDSFLILESESLSRLLPTVRSRCRIIKLAVPDQNKANAYLEGEAIAPAERPLRLIMSEGAPLTAAALDSSAMSRWREQAEAFSSQGRMTELAAFLAKQPARDALQQLLLWVDESIRCRYTGAVKLVDQDKLLVDRLKQPPLTSLFRFRDYILEIEDSLNRQANLNQQLWSEQLAARWLELTG